MELFIPILLFALGIALICKCGNLFVDAASRIAKALNIPTFIIGATIVSLATTMPEMIVSLMAAAQGKTDMAIGNAVGSVIANTSLIMATAMLAMSVLCPRRQYWMQLLLLIAAASVLLFSCRSGELTLSGSLVLAVIFVLFMAQNIISGKRDSDSRRSCESTEQNTFGRDLLCFLAGAAGIVIGSRLMVSNGSTIAAWLGVPERIIALTLISVGTSLPELVTTVSAILKKESALSIGNIIGANIIDLTLILPLCVMVSGKALPVSVQSILLDLPVCLMVTLIAAVPLLIGQKGRAWQGIVLLGLYAGYLVLVV